MYSIEIQLWNCNDIIYVNNVLIMFFFSGDTSSQRLALDIKNWTVIEQKV